MKLTSEIFLTSCFFSIEEFPMFYLKTRNGWTNSDQIRSSGTILSKKGKVYPVDWWVCFDVKQAPVAQCLTTGQGVKVNCSWQASFRYRVLLSPRRWYCWLVRCWLEGLEKLNNLPIWPIFSSNTYSTFYRIKNVFKKYFENIFLTLFMRTTTGMFSLSCKVTVVSWFNRLLSPVSHAVSSLEPKLAKNTNDLTYETSDLCGA